MGVSITRNLSVTQVTFELEYLLTVERKPMANYDKLNSCRIYSYKQQPFFLSWRLKTIYFFKLTKASREGKKKSL